MLLYMLPTGGSFEKFALKGQEIRLPDCFGVQTVPTRYGVSAGIRENRKWVADNLAFSGKMTPERFLAWLDEMAPHRETCVFAVCPDVVSDCDATLALFAKWADEIRGRGYPVAFVAQDGMEHREFPRDVELTDWFDEQRRNENGEDCGEDEGDGGDDYICDDAWYWGRVQTWERDTLSFDCLFIGGSTEWKMSEAALQCIAEAQRLGLWVHVGRVNTRGRLFHFARAGVDSVDGTCIAFGRDANMTRLLRWMAELAQLPLPDPQDDEQTGPAGEIDRYALAPAVEVEAA